MPESDPTHKTHSVYLTPPTPGDTVRSSSDGTAVPEIPAERFRILRPHAEGGLGRVYLAEDAELCREVALKEIQPRHSFEPETRARFIKEARITGGLEHPGIVPVYALGLYPDGRPYYAMRFIQGQSLKEAIDEFHAVNPEAGDTGADFGSLGFRKLLRRFIDACNAIAYAHSRGVLHRDIKPNNVMLGPYGETLVVDWGLAKSVHEPSENPAGILNSASSSGDHSLHTAPGSTVGTPAYMSPEQAQGRLDELTAATDIYGLGATLYRLLTGRNAFENRDIALLFAQIERGEFPRPRTVQPNVPPALEAICLKAMALHPLDRYRGGADLAADIERWLADETITAFGEPWPARAARWMRRHQSAVAGIGAAVGVATIALAIGLSAASKSNAQLRIAFDEAKTARDAEAAQRQLAQRRFEQARQAVDDYLGEVNKDVRLQQKDPVTYELRRALLEKAKPYYEDFLKQSGADASLQRRVASASERLASIDRELAPGPRAIELLESAKATQERLWEATPEDDGLCAEFAKTLQSLGDAWEKSGDLQAASRNFDRSLELRKRLADRLPADPQRRLDLALSHFNVAGILAKQGAFAKAVEQLATTERLQNAVVAERPTDIVAASDLARTYANQGIFQIRGGKPVESLAAFQKAQALQKRLAVENPNLVNFSEELGRTWTNIANLMGMTGKPGEALKALADAEEVFERLARDYPKVPRFRAAAATACNNAGYMNVLLGNGAAAMPLYARARSLREELLREFPAVDSHAEDLASTLVNIGNLQRDSGKPGESLDPLSKGVDLLGRLNVKQSGNAQVQEFLRNAHWGRAEALSQLKRHAEALADWDAALKLDGGSGRDQIRLARALTLARAGRYAEATREASELSAAKSAAPNSLYQAACVFARSSAAAANDVALATSVRQTQASEYASQCVTLLRKAMTAGYFNNPAAVAQFNSDEDFQSIRQRPEFAKFVVELGSKP